MRLNTYYFPVGRGEDTLFISILFCIHLYLERNHADPGFEDSQLLSFSSCLLEECCSILLEFITTLRRTVFILKHMKQILDSQPQLPVPDLQNVSDKTVHRRLACSTFIQNIC